MAYAVDPSVLRELQSRLKSVCSEVDEASAGSTPAPDWDEPLQDGSVLFSGNLEKLGSYLGFQTGWRRRYFVLTKDSLQYFETEGGVKRGEFSLSMFQRFFACESNLQLDLRGPAREVKLRADSVEDLRLWTQHLNPFFSHDESGKVDDHVSDSPHEHEQKAAVPAAQPADIPEEAPAETTERTRLSRRFSEITHSSAPRDALFAELRALRRFSHTKESVVAVDPEHDCTKTCEEENESVSIPTVSIDMFEDDILHTMRTTSVSGSDGNSKRGSEDWRARSFSSLPPHSAPNRETSFANKFSHASGRFENSDVAAEFIQQWFRRNCGRTAQTGECRQCGNELSTASFDKGNSRNGIGRTQSARYPTSHVAAKSIQRWFRKSIGDVSQLKRQRIRTKAVEEILDSERKYVSMMQNMVDCFITEFRRTSPPLLSELEIKKLFSTAEVILDLHKATLLPGLTEHVEKFPTGPPLGEVFLLMAEYLKLYTMYVQTFPEANIFLLDLQKRAEFATAVEAISAKYSARLCGNSLSSHLILPVQRLPRYVLLLSEVLKYTDESHNEHQSLCDALAKIQAIASIVNESSRQYEQRLKVLTIQNKLFGCPSLLAPHRVFLRQDSLMIITEDGRQNFETSVFFLFNDLLVCALRNGESFTFVSLCSLHSAYVFDVDVESNAYKNVFKLMSCERTYVLMAPSQDIKMSWVADVSEQIQHWQCSVVQVPVTVCGMATPVYSSNATVQVGNQVFGTAATAKPGLHLVVVNRADLALIFRKTYDTKNSQAQGNEMATELALYDETTFVIVTSCDSWANHLTLPLIKQLVRCGADPGIFDLLDENSTSATVPSLALVGIPGPIKSAQKLHKDGFPSVLDDVSFIRQPNAHFFCLDSESSLYCPNLEESLELKSNNRLSVSALITGTSNPGHVLASVEFFISVRQQLMSWSVTKTYNDFFALNKALQAQFPEFPLPPLPRYHLFKDAWPNVVDYRCIMLETYMEALVWNPRMQKCALLRDFFQLRISD